jgi:hypothetical protein
MEMKSLIERLFLRNWPRKLVALIGAVFVWFLVNQTITVTRTLSDVPVRIIHIPVDKTVQGLLPNGLLNKRISLTLTGSKSMLQDLHPTDLEVIINANGQKESWIATISKKNVVSVNPALNLHNHITEAAANDLFIKLSKLVSDEIPVTITKPVGDPPKGYQFLNIWPKCLSQKVSGPEEQVRELKQKGLELTFNLNRISVSELDALLEKQKKDEISFPVPDMWKKVEIPFKGNILEPLNDPRADLLRIDFLKQELIPFNTELPITLFFPLKYSSTVNPDTCSLATNEIVKDQNGVKWLTLPLYVRDVSHLFLEVVEDNLLLIIVAAPKGPQEDLHWVVEFIDEKAMEEAFVTASLKQDKRSEIPFTKFSEQVVRDRFRDYLRKLVFFTQDGTPLRLKAQLEGNVVNLVRVKEDE